MAQGTCKFGTCGRTGKVTRGWCGKHYKRWYKYGDPGHRERVRGEGDEARFLSHVTKMPDGCWVWTARINKGGYGVFNVRDGVTRLVHCWAYEYFVKPIPDGLELDHLCHTRERLTCLGGPRCPHRRCCNPAHLEPVTRRTNMQRGVGTKLSDEVIAVLYDRWQAGETKAALARECGVGKSTMSRRLIRVSRDRSAPCPSSMPARSSSR